jgi:hypothetical protein
METRFYPEHRILRYGKLNIFTYSHVVNTVTEDARAGA